MFEKIKNFFAKISTGFKNFLYKNKYTTVTVMVGIIVLFWDMFLKFLTDNQNVSIIKGILSFSSTYNTGAAWNILKDQQILLIILTSIFIVALIVCNFVVIKKKNYFYSISLGLLIFGAIGNLIDRINFGYVRDFIKIDFIKNGTTFNLADICITVGVIMLAYFLIFKMPKLDQELNTDKLVIEDNQNSNLNKQEINKSDVKVNGNIKKEETFSQNMEVVEKVNNPKPVEQEKDVKKSQNKTTSKSNTGSTKTEVKNKIVVNKTVSSTKTTNTKNSSTKTTKTKSKAKNTNE